MNRTLRACVCAGIVAGVAAGTCNIARAAGAPVLTGAYLFSNWSSPTTGSSLYIPVETNDDRIYIPSGTEYDPTTGWPPPPWPTLPLPAINFHGTTGVQLLLTGDTVTGIANAAPITLEIDQAMTYAGHGGLIDPGEFILGFRAEHMNSEVGKWDDVGIANTGYDDSLNLDFALSPLEFQSASVRFNPVSGPGVRGYDALIIAEDAAFDPLALSICSDEPGGCRSIISGFSPAAIDSILARQDFAASDSADFDEMGQVYVFLFDGPVSGTTTVADIGNYGGERLEVDFIGASTLVTPIPGAAWMLGSGLIALLGVTRRRIAAKA